MGTAIISGLTFATFLTLVIVPVMYSLIESVQERLTSTQPSSGEVTPQPTDAGTSAMPPSPEAPGAHA